MVEEEVEVEVFGVDLDAGLASKKGEAIAKFEQEGFDLAQDGVFKVFFEVAVVEAEEIEEVGISEYHARGNLILGAESGYFGFCKFIGLFRYRGAFEKH